MGKILRKMNGVFFESNVKGVFWFLLGIVITLFLMLTIITLDMGEMLGGMIISGVNMLLEMILPLLTQWGNKAIELIGGLFPAEINSGMGIGVCAGIAAVIIGLATFLALKKPEKMRTVDESPVF